MATYTRRNVVKPSTGKTIVKKSTSNGGNKSGFGSKKTSKSCKTC